MKKIRKRFGSVLLALCLMLTLLPTVAFAADASDLVNTISAIEGLDAVASSDGSTVTVTNTDGYDTATLSVSDGLRLTIPVGVTVVWQASATAAENMGSNLLVLLGAGTFEVADGAYLSTGKNSVLNAYCPVVVSGGIVSCDVDWVTGYSAIITEADITVTGGTVRNTSRGYAIRADGDNVSVTVTGGLVESLGYGDAICCQNYGTQFKYVSIAVSGGTVRAENGAAINMNAAFSSITVSGTAAVKATGSGQAIDSNTDIIVSGGTVSANTGEAIYANESAVTVSGGTVSATTGYAIYAERTFSPVTVNGGTVFAGGTAISGENNVIYLRDVTDGFTAPTGTGVVIAWNQGAGTIQYEKDTSTDLTVSPDGATVKWARSGEQSGISYSYSGNTGFLAVDGVTVVKPIVTTSQLSYTDPSTLSLSYNGSAQGIGIVSAASGVTLGTITVYYTGINGTDYAKSTTAPTNAGTYQVTADVAENDDYAATSGLVLGSYTIAKATPPTLTWPAAENITYGQTLADSALTSGSALGTFAWTDGTVTPNAGTSDFEVTFTPSASTLQNYGTGQSQ